MADEHAAQMKALEKCGSKVDEIVQMLRQHSDLASFQGL